MAVSRKQSRRYEQTWLTGQYCEAAFEHKWLLPISAMFSPHSPNSRDRVMKGPLTSHAYGSFRILCIFCRQEFNIRADVFHHTVWYKTIYFRTTHHFIISLFPSTIADYFVKGLQPNFFVIMSVCDRTGCLQYLTTLGFVQRDSSSK